MTDGITDTYFALLETPSLREMEMTKFALRHRTKAFSPQTYAASAGLTFASDTEAYQHWVSTGRKLGLEWAPGKDTLLKIILKAKDEAYLIDAWVAHHAAIVGEENLILLDCGSEDPEYLRKLAGYGRRMLVLPYRRYFDNIHWPGVNTDFFRMIGQNCKYVTILDADEFLVGREGAMFSSRLVKPILRRYDLPYHCGTWITADGGAKSDSGAFSPECAMDISVPSLFHGTYAGKAVARQDVLFEVNHLGHNFHVAEAVRFATEESVGRLMVVHVKNLPPAVMQHRLLKQLVANGLVTLRRGENPLEQVRAVAQNESVHAQRRAYAKRYLELESEAWPSTAAGRCTAPLIGDREPQCIPELAAALDAVDFPARLKVWRQKLNLD